MVQPIVVATLQATCLAAASNTLAQIVQAYRQPAALGPFSLNWPELLRFIVLTLITSPPNYKWQQFLERSFPGYPARQRSHLPLNERNSPRINEKRFTQREHLPGGGKPRLSIRNTVLKWFIDCITCGALVNTSLFLIIMGFLKGQDMSQIMENLRHKTFAIIYDSYKVWPVASIISFSCVPVERRIVFLSTVGLFWGIYMSIVASKV